MNNIDVDISHKHKEYATGENLSEIIEI